MEVPSSGLFLTTQCTALQNKKYILKTWQLTLSPILLNAIQRPERSLLAWEGWDSYFLSFLEKHFNYLYQNHSEHLTQKILPLELKVQDSNVPSDILTDAFQLCLFSWVTFPRLFQSFTLTCLSWQVGELLENLMWLGEKHIRNLLEGERCPDKKAYWAIILSCYSFSTIQGVLY